MLLLQIVVDIDKKNCPSSTKLSKLVFVLAIITVQQTVHEVIVIHFGSHILIKIWYRFKLLVSFTFIQEWVLFGDLCSCLEKDMINLPKYMISCIFPEIHVVLSVAHFDSTLYQILVSSSSTGDEFRNCFIAKYRIFIKNIFYLGFKFRFIVFNATFNHISAILWRSVLLVEETGVPGENRTAASHGQTLSHNVVSITPRHERDSNPHL